MGRQFLVAALLVTAGCATFPEIEAAESGYVEDADYPALVPLGPLLARSEARATPEARAEVENRAEALRARAETLRGPIVDDATRRRTGDGARDAEG